jgi:hypothetical protein
MSEDIQCFVSSSSDGVLYWILVAEVILWLVLCQKFRFSLAFLLSITFNCIFPLFSLIYQPVTRATEL